MEINFIIYIGDDIITYFVVAVFFYLRLLIFFVFGGLSEIEYVGRMI